MSDERLRELERRWKESGAVEDEVVYLAERVRCGDLERPMLLIAAMFGHEAALIACDDEKPPEVSFIDQSGWITQLEEFGSETINRVVLAGAWTAYATWKDSFLVSLGEIEINTVLEAATNLLFTATDSLQHFECLRIAIHFCGPEVAVAAQIGYPTANVFRTIAAAGAMLGRSGSSREKEARRAINFAINALASSPEFQDREMAAYASIKTQIAAFIVPWALGYGDPLRERIEAHRTETP